MRLVVTILEETLDATVDAIRQVHRDHDAVEVRAESLDRVDLHAIRAATAKPLILTFRGQSIDPAMIDHAIAAGIDLVDVEFSPYLKREALAAHAEHIVLSHHDYAGMPDVIGLAQEMTALRCGETKIVVTPFTFRDQQVLLSLLQMFPRMSVIGMGPRGLYSRLAAPFLGSRLTFVSADDVPAAPGQITLDRALEIFGSDRDALHARALFAIVGNPARRSLSPSIHNRRFRERGVPAAYTVFETDEFMDIARPFRSGERFAPAGLSITAPFKEEAFAFARDQGADIGDDAEQARAVNTLVRLDNGAILAQNTDVDGFRRLLSEVCGRDRKQAAIIGAGGTARAALVAARALDLEVTVFNRSHRNDLGVPIEPISDVARFDGEIVINTLPSDVSVELPRLKSGYTYLEAAYGGTQTAERRDRLISGGVQVFTGLDLLQAQAIRQNELFMRVFDGS